MTDKIQSKDGYQIVIFKLSYLQDELRKKWVLLSLLVFCCYFLDVGVFLVLFLNEYILFMYLVQNLSQKVQSGIAYS